MRYKSKSYGPFPADLVNRTLGTEIEPGNTYLSARAQQHMAEKHPADYPKISPHIEEIIRNPTFIGQSPHHNRNIEFVKRILVSETTQDGAELRRYTALLAVTLEKDRLDSYRIVSGYTINESDVHDRKVKNRLFTAQKE